MTKLEIEVQYYRSLEQRREIAKNFTGQVAGRHRDMFGNSEMNHMTRGYMEAIEEVLNNPEKYGLMPIPTEEEIEEWYKNTGLAGFGNLNHVLITVKEAFEHFKNRKA